MFIVPYMVVAAVAILFFIVCRFMVYGIGGKSRHAGVKAEVTAKIPVRPRCKKVPVRQAVPETTAEFPLRGKSAGAGKSAGETTQILPVKEIIKKADAAMGADGATRIFDRGELEKTLPPAKMASGKVSAFTAEKAPEILEGTPTLQSLEERFVRHFLNRYGAVSSVVEQDTRMVTGHLIRNMDMDPEDMADSLTHIMVQEALQNAQRTYVLMPNDTVLSMVTDAFADVARGRRSETRTTLAYDALKAMPRMEKTQFNALSLLLLFHYSRNTDNVDMEAFRKYTRKYITPFLKELPDEYSGYQQMEYIRCVSLENREISFGRVLHDSYPLIFAYRGAMKSELSSVKSDWPEDALVPSLYNSYYKPAVVDDSLFADFCADMGITKEEDKTYLLKVLHSRPVDYDRKELSYILEKISPDLASMQEVWDTSLLRRSSLTLMGMYIARACIKATIGEEFDLSHWM